VVRAPDDEDAKDDEIEEVERVSDFLFPLRLRVGEDVSSRGLILLFVLLSLILNAALWFGFFILIAHAVHIGWDW
jgi:hypothetical protein